MKSRRLIPYFMLTALIPVILVGTALIVLSVRELKMEQRARRNQAVEKIRRQTLDQVELWKNVLKLAVSSRDLTDEDLNRRNIFLKNILNQFPEVRTLRIFSLKGDLLGHAERLGILRQSAPLNNPTQAPVLLQSRQFFRGPVQITDEGYPFLTLVHLLTSSSRSPAGYLLADISLEKLSQTLKLLPYDAAIWEGDRLVADTMPARILNQKNVIPAKAGIQSFNHSFKNVFDMDARFRGHDEFKDDAIPELGWTIVLTEPLVRTYRPALLLFLRLAIGILLVALLSLYIGVKLSRKAEIRIADQERLAAIGHMAAAVGHELRTALSVIRNSVSFLKERLDPTDVKWGKHMDMIEAEIKASNQILSDILNFSHHREVQLAPLSLNSLLEQMLAALQVPPGVQLKKYFETDLPLAFVNDVEFKQVISNVILNALQAMEDEGTLVLKTLHNKDQVSVIVEDSGGGIDPAIQKKILEPFFTTKSQGLGLGLSISKKVMDRHGGTLKITSRAGEGTTVELGFKVADVRQIHFHNSMALSPCGRG